MRIMIFGTMIFVITIMSIGVFAPALSSVTPSIMVQALDCTAPDGFVCVAPDRERDQICDTRDRFNIPLETAQELNVFADSCS